MVSTMRMQGLTSGSSARSAKSSKSVTACFPTSPLTAYSLPTSKSYFGRNYFVRI